MAVFGGGRRWQVVAHSTAPSVEEQGVWPEAARATGTCGLAEHMPTQREEPEREQRTKDGAEEEGGGGGGSGAVYLVWLRVDPAQRLEALQLAVLRQLGRQRHVLVRAGLWRHDDAAHLLHLRVVRRRRAIQKPRHLHSAGLRQRRCGSSRGKRPNSRHGTFQRRATRETPRSDGLWRGSQSPQLASRGSLMHATRWPSRSHQPLRADRAIPRAT